MKFKHRNFHFTTRKSLPAIPPDRTFENVIFMRAEPGTLIYARETGLTFIDCNLGNCVVPADSVLVNCYTKSLSHCTHLDPEMLEQFLSPCAENCSHVIDSEEIRIDGVLVDTIRTYKHTESE